MDIGKVVVYERVHELRVTYPNSDRRTGLVMGIRSASSEQAKAVMRKHTNDQFQSRGRQKRLTAELAEQQELETTASCIAWWKWEAGDKDRAGDGQGSEASYGGRKPDLDMDVAVEILGKVNWLYAQVKEASTNVENFMETPSNVSPSISDNS